MSAPGRFGIRGDERDVPTTRLLFAFLGAPVLWSLHLGAVYFFQTLDCISAWDGGRWAIVLATLAFGAGAAAAGWTAWRLHGEQGGRGEHGGESAVAPERDWVRFLLVIGIGAGALFTATILLEGLSPLLAPLCT